MISYILFKAVGASLAILYRKILSLLYIDFLKEKMSEESEGSGFRSREAEFKRRIQQRKKLLAQYYKQDKQGFGVPRKEEKYVGLSATLIPVSKKVEEAQLDMFASDEQVDGKAEIVQEQNCTDESGYYIIYSGKKVGSGKFQLVQKAGKGVFGVVAKAIDENGKQVALKILRRNEMMVASGEHEYKLLSSFRKSDYIVGLRDFFFEQGHLFLVAELMGPDLRSYIHKNQDKISLDNIRQYAIAMFMALHQLRVHKVLHADIKPDNFLMSLDLIKIKLTDFGTALGVQQFSVDVDELVARYYRAPQIILGCELPLEQRYSIDTWAVGCSLFELFTGHFLFEGSSNNQMLKLMMETRGRFSMKMLKKCKRAEEYFDSDHNFLHQYYDSNAKTTVVKAQTINITPQRQLLNLLRKHERFQQDPRRLSLFKEFLECCLALNPKSRLTPEQAFKHPFLNYMVKLS